MKIFVATVTGARNECKTIDISSDGVKIFYRRGWSG